MPERWIVIPRWEEHQHRDAARTTVPTWIKFFTRLLHDDAYLDLTGNRRAILHGLWIEYASARRQLALSTRSLSQRLNLKVTMRDLEALHHAGFIEFSASKPASSHASNLAGTFAGTEERREELPLTPPAAGTVICKKCSETIKAGATCWNCGASPRAAGSNPRALSEHARDKLHAEVLARAWQIAASWNGNRSDTFDDQLDDLERELGARLTASERLRVWDAALTGL